MDCPPVFPNVCFSSAGSSLSPHSLTHGAFAELRDGVSFPRFPSHIQNPAALNSKCLSFSLQLGRSSCQTESVLASPHDGGLAAARRCSTSGRPRHLSGSGERFELRGVWDRAAAGRLVAAAAAAWRWTAACRSSTTCRRTAAAAASSSSSAKLSAGGDRVRTQVWDVWTRHIPPG